MARTKQTARAPPAKSTTAARSPSPKTTKNDPVEVEMTPMFKEGDPVTRLTNPSYERMARAAGVKSMSTDAYTALRVLTRSKMEDILRDSYTYTEFRRAKTLSETDVLLGIQNQASQPHLAYSDHLTKNIKKC
jgi:histone H3/H4